MEADARLSGRDPIANVEPTLAVRTEDAPNQEVRLAFGHNWSAPAAPSAVLGVAIRTRRAPRFVSFVDFIGLNGGAHQEGALQ
jgi:hypothetical protein